MFRMNTYKNKGLKVPLESTLTKKGGRGTPERKAPGKARFVRPGRVCGRSFRGKQVGWGLGQEVPSGALSEGSDVGVTLPVGLATINRLLSRSLLGRSEDS